MKVIRQGVYFMEGRLVKEPMAFMTSDKKAAAVKRTAAYRVFSSHGGVGALQPDALFLAGKLGVDILRTADSAGLTRAEKTVLFAEDTPFTRSAADKFGLTLLPADGIRYYAACCAGSGKLAFGAECGFGCGVVGMLVLPVSAGDALRLMRSGASQDVACGTFAVHLRGKLRRGAGGEDMALSLLSCLEKAGDFMKGKVLEFFGAGLANLSVDVRFAADAVLTRAGYSTLWATDARTEEYLEGCGREEKAFSCTEPAYYDGGVTVNLSDILPCLRFGENIVPANGCTLPEPYGKHAPSLKELAYGEVPPIPELSPLSDELCLTFVSAPDPLSYAAAGSEGEFAVVFTGKIEKYDWSQAISMREEGVRAVVAAAFPPAYRTHLADRGILPLVAARTEFKAGDELCLSDLRGVLERGDNRIVAKVRSGGRKRSVALSLEVTKEERLAILAGSKSLLAGGKHQ